MDTSGTVWAATRQGLSRIRNGRVASITAAQGLPANYFYQIVEDRGHLWMTCARGIARISLEQLNAVADGRAATLAADIFGAESGMAHTTVTLAHQPTALKRRDGRLWFATTRGAAVIDLDAMPRNTIPPPVHIEEVAVNRRARAFVDGMRLGPDERDIEMHYTALSFVVPQRVQFRYKLEGFDAEWVEAGARRAAHYTNLPRGHYRFRVIASNNDGVWNETGASLAFEVLPRWYERRWVWAVMAVVVALVGARGSPAPAGPAARPRAGALDSRQGADRRFGSPDGGARRPHQGAHRRARDVQFRPALGEGASRRHVAEHR